MTALGPGSNAPRIPGVDFATGPLALFFYKVTCPVCQMAAPVAGRFQHAYPDRIVGVGEDPAPKLEAFDREHGMGFRSVPDLAPYELSSAYGLESVPTLFIVDPNGAIVQTVESWDRDGYDSASRRLADLIGAPFVSLSEPGDGLPPFRPG